MQFNDGFLPVKGIRNHASCSGQSMFFVFSAHLSYFQGPPVISVCSVSIQAVPDEPPPQFSLMPVTRYVPPVRRRAAFEGPSTKGRCGSRRTEIGPTKNPAAPAESWKNPITRKVLASAPHPGFDLPLLQLACVATLLVTTRDSQTSTLGVRT
jgi:hypothetical protein